MFIQGNIFIQGSYIHSTTLRLPDIAEIFIQQVSPAKLYNYYFSNKVWLQVCSFRLKDEEIADVEGSGLY